MTALTLAGTPLTDLTPADLVWLTARLADELERVVLEGAL